MAKVDIEASSVQSYLAMIQGVINRVAGNSASCKRWCIDAWFRRHRNVLVTTHIAGGTDFCHRRCFTDACKDAIAILSGQTPRFQATRQDYLLYEGKLNP